MRRHAVSRGHVVKRKDRVCRATRLEGTDLLKILALKKQRCPTRRIQPRACQHRRALDIGTNPLMCSANGSEIKKHIGGSLHLLSLTAISARH
jgi:hypothetical protein